MFRDPRGGHNRKKVNENFFKRWTPRVAYSLGLLLADGAFEDVRKSSRTCYIQLTSTDKYLVDELKISMNSLHNIISIPPKERTIRGQPVHSSRQYCIRIGNKVMYNDLLNMGLAPKKAERISIPQMPQKYFNFFVRGYFDGDGCVNIYRKKNSNSKRLSVIFTSCCKSFLDSISGKIGNLTAAKAYPLFFQRSAYRLLYRGVHAKKLLAYMYCQLNKAPFLQRKYQIYQSYLSLASN